ncbi:MAG TPA: hypothetical protein VML55_09045, partial [Planctomycetaceae bacterium]|nr:hypothetical protein [Planctomycetaceae bacterium]
MAWVVYIEPANGSALGALEDVRERMQAALPGIVFYREPSGLEKIAAVSFEFPDFLREHLERQPAEIQADY